jgi:hypothetical protein
MARATDLDQRDNHLAAELEAFKNGIGPYAVRLGISPAQVSAHAADTDYFSYTLAVQELLATGSKQWNGWKTLLRDGGNVPSTGTPQPPVFPVAPPPVAPGVEPRFRALVRQIKVNANYNPSIGASLGLEDAYQTGPNYATLAPAIDAVIGDMNVRIAWNWSGYAAYLNECELQVDRCDGKGFVVLAIGRILGYVDTEPFPLASAQWTYRAIYRSAGNRVGQWSKPVSLTVGG